MAALQWAPVIDAVTNLNPAIIWEPHLNIGDCILAVVRCPRMHRPFSLLFSLSTFFPLYPRSPRTDYLCNMTVYAWIGFRTMSGSRAEFQATCRSATVLIAIKACLFGFCSGDILSHTCFIDLSQPPRLIHDCVLAGSSNWRQSLHQSTPSHEEQNCASEPAISHHPRQTAPRWAAASLCISYTEKEPASFPAQFR